jgi:phosphatidylglycerophosphatase A
MGSQPMNEVKFWIAVGLGSGLSPKAPGTTGTLGVLPLLVLMWDASVLAWTTGLVILCALSIWSIPEAGRRLGEPDHGQIVIDEWAGMWLVAFGLNTLTELTVWMGLLIGFIGFRIFDIAKPWAVSWCERKIPGAWGVLMDDIAAGGYVLILALVFGMLSAYSG